MRRSVQLIRFMLGWFVLSLGVSIASPLVQPPAVDLVCSSSGGLRLVVLGDDATEVRGHTLECPLCASIAAPPPLPNLPSVQPSPLAHFQHPLRAAPVAFFAAPPLPSRGPPAISH
jgi:hypothetical protein